LGTFAEKFGSEQELHEWLISFYEGQLHKFLSDIGGYTDNKVKITPRLIKITMSRYSQLMEKTNVTDW
jgi:hypothetical protein